MPVVSIVLNKKLLRAIDEVAHRTKRNRSAVVRDALRDHLRNFRIREMEDRDRQGYLKHPEDVEESRFWEAQAVWPEE